MMTDVKLKHSIFKRNRELFSIALVVLTSLCALTLLYAKAVAVSPQAKYEYTKALRDLREADVEIDSEVLSNRLEITRNYDRLTFFIRKAQHAASQISAIPAFMHGDDKDRVANKANELQKILENKFLIIDKFKRRNAILRNSLSYFPSYTDEFLKDAKLSGELKDSAENYARHILSFSRSHDSTRQRQVSQARQRLVAADARSKQSKIQNLLRHGDTIVKNLPELDSLTHQLKELQTAREFDSLNHLYAQGCAHAEDDAELYRKLLYLLALCLTTYLAYTFIRLERTRKSLALAHDEISQRYTAQLLAEESLRLHHTAFYHAHDGMLLAKADGTIIEVNPSFTRITGFTREETIGHNPRIIKSGRHDHTFYSDMWKSIANTGSWQGEIWNRNKYGEIYPELLSISALHNSEGETTNYVGIFSDITKLKEQEKQLTQLAYFDALTELPNRIRLADRMSLAIAQSKRAQTILAVCYLDLDGFKPVNDTYGHEAGDRLLIEMARRLKTSVRGGDTVSRLGGDEFVLLLLDLKSIDECEQTVQRILHAITQPLHIAPEPLTLSASIGVALYVHNDTDPDTLLRNADQAMYQAKQSGKNCYRIFDDAVDRRVRSQHDYLSRIQEALDNREFILYYQPKVNMRTGKVIGAEALIRWNHPERGLVSPGEFLPQIEGHDLIIQLGKWVIETAIQQLAIWKRVGLDLIVSINIASLHLQSNDFFQHLNSAFSAHPGLQKQLELEILETSALEDIARVSSVIEQCHNIGITFSLDDFGTGYSSLSYLKRLQVSTIKIDQSFVREITSDPNDLVIIQGVLGLAKAFQRNVIAEGVETVEQGRILLQLQCDHAQGYGIARPMPAEQIPSWVQNWAPYPEWVEISNLSWAPADNAILTAKVEHWNWVSQLTHAVLNELPIPHRCLGDHNHCLFGQWYYEYGIKNYQHIPAFTDVEEPHKRVHEIAIEIDNFWRNGQISDAKSMLDELVRQRDAVIDALTRLEMAVCRICS